LAKFEVIVASEIIEHLTDLDTGLNSIKRFFAPDTIGFITAPNSANPEVVENEKKHGLHLQHWNAGQFYELMTNNFERVTMYSVDKLDGWGMDATIDGGSNEYLVLAKVEGIK